MTVDSKDLTNIDFDNDWQCYCQESNDKMNENTIVSSADQRWSSVDLPHMNNKDSCKWWYRKQFHWPLINQQSKQPIYLNFESSDIHPKKSNINAATLWLNGTQIFSGSLPSVNDPTELCSKLLHKHENTLVICCVNTNLSFHVCLLIYAKVICATGQVMIDEKRFDKHKDSDKKQNNVFDYKVSVDNANGRINVVFNPKRKSKITPTPSLSMTHSSQSIINENKENVDEDFLVPRLAIVILIVGTRDDVQSFIALGQTLRAAGHRVRLATHEIFRSFVRSNGLEFYPLAGDPADLMSIMGKNTGIILSMSNIIEGDMRKKRRCLADLLVSTWLACTADDDETKVPFVAEAIIANPLSFGHIHCAEKLCIPLHYMSTIPWSSTTAFSHPLANIDSSIGSKKKINLYSYDVIEMLIWTGMRDIVNNFRKKTLGLKEFHVRQTTNVLLDERVPHTYCWSPTLVAKPKDWGIHIDISGFFFLNPGTAFNNPPKGLLEFLGINSDGSYKHHKLPPPIYIEFGSITGRDSRRILSVVIDAIHQTGYRVLLSGLAADTDQLPSNIFRIGNVPHGWLFQFVSAVCHHGGAGTTAAGLRAGKPTVIVPFFGDQFFWGTVIEKNGVGPPPLPGKSVTAYQLAEAFHFVHKAKTRAAAERIRDAILKEDGCAAAVDAFHANLPLTHMHSDLEPTFAACYHLDEYNLQISRPVAQVLIAAGVLEESELRPHVTRQWQYEHDNRIHSPSHGIIKHSEKVFSSMFIDTAEDLKRAASNDTAAIGTFRDVESVVKNVSLGHLTIECLSLYGEMTDVPNRIMSPYDPYSDPQAHQRLRVIDFKSAAKAADLVLFNGRKDSISSHVKQSRTGYERYGVLGAAAESMITTVNIKETFRNEGRRISSKLFDTSSSTRDNEQCHEDDDEEISPAVKTAATWSGFHPRVCQYILHQFEKIKIEQKQKSTLSTNKTKGCV